jgi:DNA-binding transcriptional ArsR family regulator
MAPVSPYHAIADPTRRAILDLLREQGPCTTGSIATHFTTLSRPAISKHLKVLREAELVQAKACGREWHYTLDAEPLRAVEGWVARYEPFWQTTLETLKHFVENTREERGENTWSDHSTSG